MKTKRKFPNKKEIMRRNTRQEQIIVDHIMMKYRTTLQAKKQLERGILRCDGAISTLEVLLKELKHDV